MKIRLKDLKWFYTKTRNYEKISQKHNQPKKLIKN